ncbi:hypothetical protein BJ912DRAFT_1056843 [Pholiota molesta]|nr:hypothetical protein BJ912DRAFT_1056843 [Pholiota molesta]
MEYTKDPIYISATLVYRHKVVLAGSFSQVEPQRPEQRWVMGEAAERSVRLGARVKVFDRALRRTGTLETEFPPVIVGKVAGYAWRDSSYIAVHIAPDHSEAYAVGRAVTLGMDFILLVPTRWFGFGFWGWLVHFYQYRFSPFFHSRLGLPEYERAVVQAPQIEDLIQSGRP